jgi:hypothetical protein
MTDHLINSKLYHFLVYPSPLRHTVIHNGRVSPNLTDAERLSYRSELSREELVELLPYFTGLPLLLNHQGNDANDVSTFHGNQREPAGLIVAAYWHSEGLVNVVRLYDSITGMAAATSIASGNMRCVSLYHVSIGNRIQLREISLCLMGKRPRARLLKVVDADYLTLPSPGPYIERPLTDQIVDLTFLSQQNELQCFAASQSSSTPMLTSENKKDKLWQQQDEQLWVKCCDQKWPVPKMEQWQTDFDAANYQQRHTVIRNASAWLRCYHLNPPPVVRRKRILPWLWSR